MALGNGKTCRCRDKNVLVDEWYDRKRKERNEDIIDNIGVAPIEDNIRENCLRWFGHVYRRPEQAVDQRKLVRDN